jgi:RNA polymerase sigma factor (TIGR02999 family)
MDVTHVRDPIRQGDATAGIDDLLLQLYDQLRSLARARLRRERLDHTLQATALVHEVYLRLMGSNVPVRVWQSKGQLFAAASEAMRRILVESIRKRKARKRGGALRRIELELDNVALSESRDDRILALNCALARLEEIDPLKASLIKLRFFAGLSQLQAAESLGISGRTADRHWAYARAWLIDRMRSDQMT